MAAAPDDRSAHVLPAAGLLEPLLGSQRESAVRLAYHITRDREAALDLTQEALIRAIQSADSLRDASLAPVWFRRILVNLCRDWIRQRQAERSGVERLDPRPLHASADPARAAEYSEFAERVRRALLELPAEYREVLALVGVEHCSPREAAQILNLPDGTLRWRLHEARRMVRERLQADGAEE